MKTVNLWDSRVITAIKLGQLVLQTGQWVQCGTGKKSRFVGYNKSNGVFDVVHYPRTNKVFIKRSQLNKVGKFYLLKMLTKRAFKIGVVLINYGGYNINQILKCLFELQPLPNLHQQVGFTIGNLLINDVDLIDRLLDV
ncbi:hypothetical protein NVP2096O_02 [Vibrio phage 2.096.O._10N.286.48.B5]|nr:hypothetical protein NVP2096O_02 [Vibrio phage 2.096.O._10N.286.48.B5]